MYSLQYAPSGAVNVVPLEVQTSEARGQEIMRLKEAERERYERQYVRKTRSYTNDQRLHDQRAKAKARARRKHARKMKR